MPEYRIVTKIDPQTAAGAAKTKADLKSIDAAAVQTGRNLDTAVAGPASKAASAQTALGKATDQTNRSMGAARSLFGQTSMSVTDLTRVLATGRQEITAFGKTAQSTGGALGGGGGGGGGGGLRGAAMAASSVIGGVLGAALALGASALVTFAMRAFEAGESVESLVEKMKKDAEQTALNDRAKDAYGRTLEGITAAMKVHQDALAELIEGQKTEAEQTREGLRQGALRIDSIKAETEALVDKARAQLEVLRAQAAEGGGSLRMTGVDAMTATVEGRLANIEKRLGGIRVESEKAWSAYERALALSVADNAQRLADPLEKIKDSYEGPTGLIAQATAMATAEEVRNGTLYRQVQLLKQKQKAEEDAYRASQRNAPSDGVARFRSREQAIGIAGRELQRGGLSVGENAQFGGVKANHPGMGNAAHGRFAIDVNAAAGAGEQAPDLKQKFNQLARLYQSRGYRVLWDGQVWEANGNGPTRPIPSGQHQHKDHMHIEAPATIVGKATQGSMAAELLQEQREGARTAESKSDFVQGVVDKAAGRGGPDNRAAKLSSEIGGVLADYKRKFNEAASPEEVAKITGALTEAEARAQAEHFREAYQYPLEDLQASLGRVGMAREVHNALLEEARRKGEALTPEEEIMIENSVRMTDQYERQREILERLLAPMEAYAAQVRALNDLLATGRINQTSYNAELADLQGPARDLVGQMNPDQMDPNSGLSYGDLSETLDENARYAIQLEALRTHREALLALNVNYNALEANAKQEHENRIAAIEQARRSTQIMAASNLFGSLAEITRAGMGEQSAIYKAMFIASKAFAIADSIIKIQQAMASAAMSLPFPANLPAIATVAALGASIIANIMSASLALASGGIVRGPGGPQDDAIPARLSNGEFVVNAAATQRNRALLEAVNNGAVVDRQRRGSTDQRVVQAAGGNTTSFSFGDVVVQAGNATASDGEAIGHDVKRAIGALIDEKLARESRSGGRLTRTNPSVMTS